ncbi:MAG: rod shape-determining protein MreC [Frankiaceae bacterium]|nr:rod shape-determining protein MreC [Frankiaceae bacterium]
MGRDNRRTRLLLFALLATALALITVDYRVNGADSRLRAGLHDVVGPVERGLGAVTSPIGNLFDGHNNAAEQRRRADRLQAQVDDLQRRLATGAEAQRVAAELERLRLLADRADFSIVPSRVIAFGDVTGTEQTVDVDAGSQDGLAVGQLVINSQGLVGVVARVGSNTSVVRLATDPATVIGARLEGSEALGRIAGAGSSGTVSFTLYDPTLPLTAGTRVVTYGSSDYAGGVPVGTVTRQLGGSEGLTRRAEVRPFANFGSLDLVGVVVRRPQANPGDRLLPPRPVKAPAAAPAAAVAPAQPSPSSPSPIAAPASAVEPGSTISAGRNGTRR